MGGPYGADRIRRAVLEEFGPPVRRPTVASRLCITAWVTTRCQGAMLRQLLSGLLIAAAVPAAGAAPSTRTPVRRYPELRQHVPGGECAVRPRSGQPGHRWPGRAAPDRAGTAKNFVQ